MSSGDDELDAMIASIRELPKLAEQAAPDAADACHDALRATIAAGTDPTGKAWEPKKVGGGKPLANADEAVRVAAIGPRIFFRLRGYVARHHLGRAKGGVVRQVLPVTGIPTTMAAAIKRTLDAKFRELTGGAG